MTFNYLTFSNMKADFFSNVKFGRTLQNLQLNKTNSYTHSINLTKPLVRDLPISKLFARLSPLYNILKNAKLQNYS